MGFPIWLVFQTVMPLQRGELVPRSPITGGIYRWAKYLGGEWLGLAYGRLLRDLRHHHPAAACVIINVILNGLFPSIALGTRNSIITAIVLTLLAGLVTGASMRIAGPLNGFGVVLDLFALLATTILLCSIESSRCM